MSERVRIDRICFVPAPAHLRVTGLRGWASVVIDDRWHVDGLAVRRTLGGKTVLTFPSRVDGHGVEHPYVRPVSNELRSEIEAQVVAHVRKAGYLE